MNAIDIHFHAVPPLFVDALRAHAFAASVEMKREGDLDRLIFHAPAGVPVEAASIKPRQFDRTLLLQALDERLLSAAAISPPPELFMYWAPAELGARMATIMNDGFAQMASADPDRFLPLATLPMQSPMLAAAELERAVTVLGLRGAAICTHVNGVDLDNAAYDPVFAMAERLGVPVFLHPQNSGDISRLEQYHLWNLIGFPIETATAAARLVMSGMFERHPRLTVVLAHGGGYFPYQVGRLDHGWRARKEASVNLPRPPSSYLGNIICDSLTHSPESLRFLIERIGIDHIVLGTDYPFDMKDDTPVQSVQRLGLPREQEKLILSGTLERLLAR